MIAWATKKSPGAARATWKSQNFVKFLHSVWCIARDGFDADVTVTIPIQSRLSVQFMANGSLVIMNLSEWWLIILNYSVKWSLRKASYFTTDLMDAMGIRTRGIKHLLQQFYVWYTTMSLWLTLLVVGIHCVITSWNGNIFHVTGHLCGEFPGSRWIPRKKASQAELWCFLWSASE